MSEHTGTAYGAMQIASHLMSDRRLIEKWLPIAELSEECARERRSMTALPPVYYLHVWWARRPLVASRAAVLGSLLPDDADPDQFLDALGIEIDKDPVNTRRRLNVAKLAGKHLGANPYGYKRAFTYSPTQEDREWVKEFIPKQQKELSEFVVLDPTAGGGSIPFETIRMGLRSIANDLNPVAGFLLMGTVKWPAKHGRALQDEFAHISSDFLRRAAPKFEGVFPKEPKDVKIVAYLWAHTVRCPYCNGVVPLSPTWRLAPDGTGVRLQPDIGGGPGSADRICKFGIVMSAAEQSAGTVSRGTGDCPYPDCGRIVDGTEIKRQAQNGEMDNQLYAVVYKKRVPRILKSGKPGRDKWVRGYRAPRASDDNAAEIRAQLEEKLPEWMALDIVPSERIPDGNKTTEPHRYGMQLWRDMFSPRQLLCHGIGVEVFREMLDADRKAGNLTELRSAAYGYLTLALDKFLAYNSRMSSWHAGRQVMASVFSQHDFSFKWSYAEMAPLVTGSGYDWVTAQVGKCTGDLVKLVRPDAVDANDGAVGRLFKQPDQESYSPPPVEVTCKSADNLDYIADGQIDAIVMDPPYYDNVMYAELSDFFYVWLKRTAGYVFPELFRRQLTDKDNEAVANPARYKGKKGAKARAGKDYQERMAAIFQECRRVLKSDGIMTLMFTHKATGAWDALTAGLMEAGFKITASWPINTEAPGSLHIKDKAAANSTIFLACRPRTKEDKESSAGVYWEDVEPDVARAVRRRIPDFREAGIRGVDIYLASFGPALEEFSRHWPLRRGTPRTPIRPQKGRFRQADPLAEKEDPYAATPEDALEVARREVKRWRLEQLTRIKASDDMDARTAFFVLAWDAFRAPRFPYDEALKLGRAVGADLDREIVGRMAAKKGQNLILWDSAERAATGSFGPIDGSRGMIDAVHRAAHLARIRSLDAAREHLFEIGLHKEPRFLGALEALLEVLPVSKSFTGFDLPKGLAAAGSDFEALEHLRRLAFAKQIGESEQLKLALAANV